MLITDTIETVFVDGNEERWLIHERVFGENYEYSSGWIRNMELGKNCAITIPKCSVSNFKKIKEHILSQAKNLSKNNTIGKIRWYDLFKYDYTTGKYSNEPSLDMNNVCKYTIDSDGRFHTSGSSWMYSNFSGRFNMNSIKILYFGFDKKDRISLEELCTYMDDGDIDTKNLIHIVSNREFKLEENFVNVIDTFKGVTLDTLANAYNKYIDKNIGTVVVKRLKTRYKVVYNFPDKTQNYELYRNLYHKYMGEIKEHTRLGHLVQIKECRKIDNTTYNSKVDYAILKRDVEEFKKMFDEN